MDYPAFGDKTPLYVFTIYIYRQKRRAIFNELERREAIRCFFTGNVLISLCNRTRLDNFIGWCGGYNALRHNRQFHLEWNVVEMRLERK